MTDVYGAEAVADDIRRPGFLVHAVLPKSAGSVYRRRANQHFVTATRAEAHEWVHAIRTALRGEDTGRRRRLLLVINPVGGTRKAVPTFRRVIEPMLKIAQIEYQAIRR